MKALTTHRKCLVCGNTTSNLSKDTCSCGSYMHLVSQMYSPKVVTENTESKSKGQ